VAKSHNQTLILLELIDVTDWKRTQKSLNTGYTQKNGAVSEVNKKFISQLTWAQHTLSDAATVKVSHTLIRNLQFMHPWSHNTHPHGNQTHPGVACPL
jgi:hypothetical protein